MAEEFDPAKAAEAFKAGGGDEAVASFQAATDKLATQYTQTSETTYQDFDQDDIDTYLGRGNAGDASKIPKSLQPALNELKAQLEVNRALAEKILQTADPNVKLSGNFDNDTDDSAQGKINKAAMKAFDDGMVKRAVGSSTDPKEIVDKLNELGKKLDDKANKEPDPKKRSTLKTIAKYFLGFVLTAGSVVGGIVAGLYAMAKHDTGCYWIKTDVTGQGTELNCSTKNGLQTNCDCSTVDKLKSVNMCDVDPTHNCDAKYQYVYQTFDIWNEFNKVAGGAGADLEKGGALFQQIIDFFTKYGLWMIIGLVALIALPLVLSLFKSFS